VQLIKGPLAHIYNLSLNSGVFPDIWKTAKVKPLYKKGDKYDMKNYTPISIIPVFVKLLERLMYNRIMSFLYENKILSEAQNGLRKGKSIHTAVQSFIGRIQKALDIRVHTIGIQEAHSRPHRTAKPKQPLPWNTPRRINNKIYPEKTEQ